MPELPEVETIRRELADKLIGRKIKRIEVLAKQSVHNEWPYFKRTLVGNHFSAIGRRGKLLIFNLAKPEPKLLIHLKMTGQLVYQHGQELIFGGHKITASDLILPNRFTRLVFHFIDRSALYFNDMRRFGFLRLVSIEELDRLIKKSYGLDALSPDFKLAYFLSVLKRRGKTNIKAALLDQKHLAGIGNIYADEVCFAAKVKPGRRVSSITRNEVTRLYQAIKHILKLAIKHGGTTFTSKVLAGHYLRSDGARGNFTSYLKVYDRAKERCLRCHRGIIQKIRLAGRGTHFCPVCQK